MIKSNVYYHLYHATASESAVVALMMRKYMDDFGIATKSSH